MSKEIECGADCARFQIGQVRTKQGDRARAAIEERAHEGGHAVAQRTRRLRQDLDIGGNDGADLVARRRRLDRDHARDVRRVGAVKRIQQHGLEQ